MMHQHALALHLGEVMVRNRLLGILCFLILVSPAAAAVEAAPGDTLRTNWGPVTVPADTARFRPEPIPTPAWKHVVRIPYYIGAVPVTIVDWTLRYTLVELDRLGLFATAETVVAGLRGPLGNYWLPTGSYGETRGLEYGIQAQRPFFPAPNWVTKFRIADSTRRASSWSLGTRSDLGSSEWFEVGGGGVRDSQLKYYGTGVGTDGESDSYYRRDLDWAGASWRHEWPRYLESKMAVYYSTVAARASRYEVDEALEVVFADDIPYGYDSTSAGMTVALKLGYDSTDSDGHPHHGLRTTVFAERFIETDDSQLMMWTWGASLERYFGLWLPQRTLALKAWWLQQDSLGGDSIPFTRLITNRDPYKLRGFGSHRFHAAGSTGLTAEYRWPFWIYNEPDGAGIDAYVFTDVGQPFDHSREVAMSNLLWSTGLGFRTIDNEGGFGVRAEIAWGDEGMHLRLTAKQVFQFIKAGFYDGSEPLPVLR